MKGRRHPPESVSAGAIIPIKSVWRSLVSCCLGVVLLAGIACTGTQRKAEEAPAVHEVPASDGSPSPVISRSPGSLVRIDARTGRIVARVPIPFPRLLASDGRSVWVFTHWAATEPLLVLVDPATNEVTRSFGVERAIGTLAVAGGSVWLGDYHGRLYRLAPGPNVVESANPYIPELENYSGGGLVGAAGSLWLSWFPWGGCCPHPPDLYRVDPATGRVIARIEDAVEIVASGPGFVWSAGYHQGQDMAGIPFPQVLMRIDAETNAITPISPPRFEWAEMTVADGAVWASNPGDDTIVRLDPVTGKERGQIHVGGEPSALASGAGAVWAAISSNGTVARYDIESDRIKAIDVGGEPQDLVFAHGSIWVAVFGPKTAQ